MSPSPPPLEKLLSAVGRTGDESWAEFAREYSTLLLHVARSSSSSRDDAMDAYAYLLERLSENDYRRLRAYTANPNTKFTTWLVIVARRICIDHNRLKYGRLREVESVRERERLVSRRRLEDLADRWEGGGDVADENTIQPDRAVEAAELSAQLASAVSALASGDQLLIRLRFEDGLSAAEIADLLRFPSQFHVYRRINALLDTLRASLRARGIESAAS
jgi:RNA polymerase sigma factor (sigma-70 family)